MPIATAVPWGKFSLDRRDETLGLVDWVDQISLSPTVRTGRKQARVTTHSMKMAQQRGRITGVMTMDPPVMSTNPKGKEMRWSWLMMSLRQKKIENQRVTHLRDPKTIAPRETFRPDSPELIPRRQPTPFSLPEVENTPSLRL